MARENPCFVYVMGFKDRPDWPKKIGVATDIAARFASHQTSNPFELEVLITMPGDERVETKLHARFSAKHVRGEWFDLDDADLAWIAAVDPAALPDTVPCEPGQACSVWILKTSKSSPHGRAYSPLNRPCPEPAVGRLARGVDGSLYCAHHLALATEPHKVCDMPGCGGEARFSQPWGGRLLCRGHERALAEGRKIPPGPPPAWALELLAPAVPDGSTCPECGMPSAGNPVAGRPELCLVHDAWLRQPAALRCQAGVPPRAVAVPAGGKWRDRVRFVADDGGCPFPGDPLVHDGAEHLLCSDHRYRLVERGSADWEYDPLRDNSRVRPTLARKQ